MRLAVLLSIAVCLPHAAAASGRYDPRLRFQTMSTTRFDIHYHQGEEAEARRLARIAERVAAELDRTLGRPSGRVQVILVAQSDLSNGWATALPYNTIEITAAAPVSGSMIGNTDDWLSLVFTHEYTHVVHLSRGRGWIGGLRRVFGRMPVLFPNAFLPIWQIEGLAVYEESAITGYGRVPAGDFRSIIDAASAASRLEPLDRSNGGLIDWPSGHAPYVYGAYFHSYLAARFGAASIAQLTDATAGRAPFFGSTAFKRIFKRSLGDLWQDFEADRREKAAVQSAGPVQVTRFGFNVVRPRFGPDGRLYFSVVDPHGFPALMSLAPGEARPRRVANRYLGGGLGFSGSMLVFDQIEVENQVGLQSDLYSVETAGGRPRRLTRGARAADPDVSSDGRRVVFTVQQTDRRELAIATLSGGRTIEGRETLVSEEHANFASPRWSPDGRFVAAERQTRGLRPEIVVVEVATKAVRPVAPSVGRRSASPAWTSDGELVYAADDGTGFRLFRTNLETLATWRLEGTGPSAQSPEISRDGQQIVFVGYSAAGSDVYSVPLPSALWTPVDAVHAATPAAAARPSDTPGDAPAARYSPWRTLAPRFWIPTIESDADELVLGAATSSADALGRHAYAAGAGWSTRGRPDWQVAYAYDRWWPTLFADVSDDTDPWRDGDVRTIEANGGVLLPFRRVRWSQFVLGALHASTDRFSCSDCGPAGASRVVRRAVRAGWLLNNSRSYGYSISREDGWQASITTELARAALGSDGDAGSATIDVRGYLPVRPRHAVVAARVAGATTWGDDRVRRIFSAAGNGPQLGGFNFGSDAIGLMRGVDESDLLGLHAAVLNLDYRVPLLRIQRGVGTLPVFARTIHGALFGDVGHAWNASFRRQDVRTSFGGEVSFDTVIAYVWPVTFTAGAAWVSDSRGVVAFGRIGRAF
jgi:Tol biopolymer transport system component